MPEIISYDIDVTVVVEVRERVFGRPLLKVVTHGRSNGDSAEGLPKSVAPALADALADSAKLIDNYRKAR